MDESTLKVFADTTPFTAEAIAEAVPEPGVFTLGDSLLGGPDVLVELEPEVKPRVARFDDESEFDGEDVWGDIEDLTDDDPYVVIIAEVGTKTLGLRSELADATKGDK